MRTNLILLAFNEATIKVGMKPLSERDENSLIAAPVFGATKSVGMKPLSERDENRSCNRANYPIATVSRNEATL